MLKEVFGKLLAALFNVVRLRTKTCQIAGDAKCQQVRVADPGEFSLGCARTSTLFVEWLVKLVNASRVFALGSFGFELLILLRSQKSAKLNNRTELAWKSLK